MCKSITMSWKKAQNAALALCKGVYQSNLILGREPISGAGFKGKAREFSASYARSRRSIKQAMVYAGIPFNVGTGKSGWMFLVFGDWATTKIGDIDRIKRQIKQRRYTLMRDTRLLRIGEEDAHKLRVKKSNKYSREASEVCGNLARASEVVLRAARSGKITPSVTERVNKSIENAEKFLESSF